MSPSAKFIHFIPDRDRFIDERPFFGVELPREWEIDPFGNNQGIITRRFVAREAGAEIGEFVRARRRASKLSQKELGELAGVGPRFISELERGKPSVRLNAVQKVLSVFGKTLGIVEPEMKDDAP
ncbi:MAG: helix-turn-helix transcriptional regulator [Pirellulales bacterium]